MWQPMLEEIATASAARGAMLITENLKAGIIASEGILEPMRAYADGLWNAHDPYLRAIPRQRRGQVVIESDIVLPDERRTSVFFNELQRPFHLTSWLGAGFSTEPYNSSLSLLRTKDQPDFTVQDAQIFSSHTKRLSEVGTLSVLMGQRALGGVMQALERVGSAAVAIDVLGRVVSTNERAEALFGEPMNVVAGRLRVADPEAAAKLAIMLDRIQSMGEGATPDLPPIIVRTKGRPFAVLRAVGLDQNIRRFFTGARALITITPVQASQHENSDLVRQTLSLTPAEGRIAALLTDGTSLEMIASELRITRETVRGHVKAIFAKSGVRRQSELVALLGRLRGP